MCVCVLFSVPHLKQRSIHPLVVVGVELDSGRPQLVIGLLVISDQLDLVVWGLLLSTQHLLLQVNLHFLQKIEIMHIDINIGFVGIRYTGADLLFRGLSQ